MKYFTVLDELFSSDTLLIAALGFIAALVLGLFTKCKKNILPLAVSLTAYALCEVLLNFITNYFLEILLLFAGTASLGAFIGFLAAYVVKRLKNNN